jgi:hypothetical protein
MRIAKLGGTNLFSALTLFIMLASLVLGLYAVIICAVAGLILLRGAERSDRLLGPNAILYFRAFRDVPVNKFFLDTIDPVLTCFGRVWEVAAQVDFKLPRLIAFTNLALLRRPRVLGALELDSTAWREELIGIMNQIKLALVDYSTETDNVRWEVELAIRTLGSHRILMLVRNEQSVVEVSPSFPQVTILPTDSGTFVADLATALSKRLSPPSFFKRKALSEFLVRGKTSDFIALLCCDIPCRWFIEGLRRS